MQFWDQGNNKSNAHSKSSRQGCPLHTSIFYAGIPSAAEAGDIIASWRHDLSRALPGFSHRNARSVLSPAKSRFLTSFGMTNPIWDQGNNKSNAHRKAADRSVRSTRASSEPFPQRLKPGILLLLCGTTEVVPFPVRTDLCGENPRFPQRRRETGHPASSRENSFLGLRFR